MSLADNPNSDSLGPLFETAVTRLLAAVPADIRAALAKTADGPLADPATLEEELDRHILTIERASTVHEFVDVATAKRVNRQAHALIAGLSPTSSNEERRLIQMAVRYFIDPNDADDDLTSPIGFDDDAQVIEHVAKALGRQDVLDMMEDS